MVKIIFKILLVIIGIFIISCEKPDNKYLVSYYTNINSSDSSLVYLKLECNLSKAKVYYNNKTYIFTKIYYTYNIDSTYILEERFLLGKHDL